MKTLKYTVLPVFLATAWISICEFTRNQFLLMSNWIGHYKKMGLTFPAEPINGAVWGIWASLFSVFIFILAKKFNFLQTVLVAWTAGFALMWIVTGNLGVLPFEILYYAIPLSFLEVVVAVWLVKPAKEIK